MFPINYLMKLFSSMYIPGYGSQSVTIVKACPLSLSSFMVVSGVASQSVVSSGTVNACIVSIGHAEEQMVQV